MGITKKNSTILIALLICIPVFALIHLSVGQIDISFQEIWRALTNYDEHFVNEIIVSEIRIPRLSMALLAGASLSVVGLLMQTLFNNPLAGPYVLGINSGSSLFVALSIMTGVPFFASDFGIIANALVGAFLFGLIILFFSRLVRTQVALLLIGLMLGAFISAFVSFLQSASDAQELKVFTLWALGSLQKVESAQLPIIILVSFIGMAGAFLIIKPLNILVLGENEAKLLGVNIKRVRLIIISITAILTGIITAFCGPIAFVGLAVPNLVRILFKTQQHFILISASLLMGALFILICDIVIQLLEPHFLLPINVLTSIIGAPMVILFILKRLK
ncbi:MAG: iron ABC transporter permease [Fluviicola sp.]|nr:iron ABC transporter permease [Fluviicola sp.]